MWKRALFVPGLVASGCSIDGLDPLPAQQETEQQSEVTNLVRSSANVLVPQGLTSTALTTATLDATGAAAMGSTQAARKVLAYAVGCALASTQTVSFTVSGTTFTDTGGLGIVPGWTTSPLTATQAAWVSACVIAHANELSTVIWISVRGVHASLAPTTTEQADYRIEEGAFWGNLFVDRGPIAGYSCNGVDQSANDTYAELPERDCAQWDGVSGSYMSPCGLGYAGPCGNACTTATAPYAGCSFRGGAAASAVVTTFLAGSPR